MTSQTLREARKYEEASEKLIKEEEKPAFHLAARTGWMNDPNGFSYYKGEYASAPESEDSSPLLSS